MENSESLFVIKRNRKLLVFAAITGFITGILGVCFLYCNSIAPSSFLKWCGIITIAIGLIVIYRSIIYFIIPLIVANNSGVWFDIAVLRNRIFIPWNGIKKIEKEVFGMLSLKWKSSTPCLVFEINNECVKKIPLLLKSVYYKSGNKIYFASGILSIPIDNVLTKLSSIQKGAV